MFPCSELYPRTAPEAPTWGSLSPGRATASRSRSSQHTPPAQTNPAPREHFSPCQLHCNTQRHPTLNPHTRQEHLTNPAGCSTAKHPRAATETGGTQRRHQITTHKAQLRLQTNWQSGHTTSGLSLLLPAGLLGRQNPLHVDSATQHYQNSKEKEKPFTYLPSSSPGPRAPQPCTSPQHKQHLPDPASQTFAGPFVRDT